MARSPSGTSKKSSNATRLVKNTTRAVKDAAKSIKKAVKKGTARIKKRQKLSESDGEDSCKYYFIHLFEVLLMSITAEDGHQSLPLTSDPSIIEINDEDSDQTLDETPEEELGKFRLNYLSRL